MCCKNRKNLFQKRAVFTIKPCPRCAPRDTKGSVGPHRASAWITFAWICIGSCVIIGLMGETFEQVGPGRLTFRQPRAHRFPARARYMNAETIASNSYRICVLLFWLWDGQAFTRIIREGLSGRCDVIYIGIVKSFLKGRETFGRP